MINKNLTFQNTPQTQEFGPNLKLDVSEAMLLALWHMQWWNPKIESNTHVKFEQLLGLAEKIKSFDIATRRELAQV
jgi:hypothetical protein